MSIIKPRANRVRTVRHIARLQEPDRDVLVQYARFIGDTADYVLNQLIEDPRQGSSLHRVACGAAHVAIKRSAAESSDPLGRRRNLSAKGRRCCMSIGP
jgi:hypothetical protein